MQRLLERRWFPAVLLTTLVVLTFGISLRGDFLAFDDELLLVDNPTAHGLSAANIKTAWTTYDPELYIPLTLTTFQTEYSLFGLHPLPFRVTNLLLHSIAAFLVFLLLTQYVRRDIALLGAALFAVHPLQTEAVAWISGRKDLLAGVLGIATVVLWQREATGRHRWSLLAFGASLLAKPSLVLLPVALALLAWQRNAGHVRKHVLALWPYLLLSLVAGSIGIGGKTGVLDAQPLEAVQLAVEAVPFALRQWLWPLNLSIFYPASGAPSWSDPLLLTGIALIVGLTALGWILRQKAPSLLVGWLWFLTLLLPSALNAVKGNDGGVDYYLFSDRYTYVAMIGLLFPFLSFLQRRRWGTIFLLCCILACMALSVRQARTWTTSRLLFQRVIDGGWPSHVAAMNLGNYAAQDGNMDRAAMLLDEALSWKRTQRALYNRAAVAIRRGEKDLAAQLLMELLQRWPDDTEARVLFGKIPR